MSEWRRVWHVTITWRTAADSPVGTPRYTCRVERAAHLRRLVARGRADPRCTGVRYTSTRELLGDPPARCPAGHPFGGGSATAPRWGWLACPCGGHLTVHCRAGGACGREVIDPPVGPDCDPAPPAAGPDRGRPGPAPATER